MENQSDPGHQLSPKLQESPESEFQEAQDPLDFWEDNWQPPGPIPRRPSFDYLENALERARQDSPEDMFAFMDEPGGPSSFGPLESLNQSSTGTQNQYGAGSVGAGNGVASGTTLPPRRNVRRAHPPTDAELELFDRFVEMEPIKNLKKVNGGIFEVPPTKMKIVNKAQLPTNKTLNQNFGHLIDIFIRTILKKTKGDFSKTRYWLQLRHPGYKEKDGFWINHKTYAMADGHTVINKIASHMQSNKNLDLGDSFEIAMQVFKNSVPVKGSGSIRKFIGRGNDGVVCAPLGKQVMNKFGVQTGIVVGETHCLPKALVIGKMWSDYQNAENENVKKELHKNYVSLTRKSGSIIGRANRQLEAAKKFLVEVKMDPESGEHSLEDVEAFSKHLFDYQIEVWVTDGDTIVPKLEKTFNKTTGIRGHIGVFFSKNHYDFFKPTFSEWRAIFCHKCSQIVTKGHWKTCKAVCRRCGMIGCRPEKETVLCENCKIVFRSKKCYDGHLLKSTPKSLPFCAKYKKCLKCFKIHSRQEYKHSKHVCYATKYCTICGSYTTKKHKCCHKIPTKNKKKELRDKQDSWTMVVYDFECIVSSTAESEEKSAEGVEHEPNLVVYRLICNKCLGSQCNHCGPIGHFSYKKYPGRGEEGVVKKFAEFLMEDKRLKNAFVIAHNGGRYDHVFLLTTIAKETGQTPKFIANGSSIINATLEIAEDNTLTFRDSVRFMPMRLSAMPAAFGLEQEAKGYFPYMLNHRGNYGKTWDTLPDVKFYEPQYMSTKERTKFEEWHKTNKNKMFIFDEEILMYCENDVEILTAAICQYIKNCQDMFNGWNPIIQTCTLAGFVMFVMKHEHIEKDVVGFIPETGFTGRNNSVLALKYIRWLEFLDPTLELKHTLRGGEQELKIGEKSCFVDAFNSKTGEISEINGCLWHGCENCFPDREASCPRNKATTMQMLFEKTMTRQKALEEAGYKVHAKWECEISMDLKRNREMRKFFKNCRNYNQLQPRQAMYGGRTQGFQTIVTAGGRWTIKYFDYCSLYPYVNMKGTWYPKGQPRRITIDFELIVPGKLPYRGLIFCDVLPPPHLKLPVLPYRVYGKLLFPLCRSCAEDRNQGKCTHLLISERYLTGAWCSDELQLALDEGYTILKYHEVWHWPEEEWFRGGFFASFLKPLLKMKHEASGWPRPEMTEEEKHLHVEGIAKNDDVLIEASKVEKNPGLRSLTKLFLNSAWGKFAQNPQKTEIRLIPLDDHVEIANFFNESGYEPKRFSRWGDSHVLVARQVMSSAVKTTQFTNVVYGALTTSAARVRLYEAMKKIGADRLIYCDTDSVVFKQEKGVDILGDLKGDGLGMLTDEIPTGTEIDEMVTVAPKVYGLKLRNVATGEISYSIKAKGVTLNSETTKKVNYDSMKEMMKKYVKHRDVDPLTAERVLFKRGPLVLDNITSVYQNKILRPVTDKGRFTSEGQFQPFGLQSTDNTIENDYEC